jgi:hypothetical protein
MFLALAGDLTSPKSLSLSSLILKSFVEYLLVASSISSIVPSVEPPSTKITSIGL